MKVSDTCNHIDDDRIEVTRALHPFHNGSGTDASKRKSESVHSIPSPEKK